MGSSPSTLSRLILITLQCNHSLKIVNHKCQKQKWTLFCPNLSQEEIFKSQKIKVMHSKVGNLKMREQREETDVREKCWNLKSSKRRFSKILTSLTRKKWRLFKRSKNIMRKTEMWERKNRKREIISIHMGRESLPKTWMTYTTT